MTRTIPVAAIQMAARLADVPGNIAQVGDLAEQALKAGARMVALPEFFTTQIIYDERLYGCSLPPDNPALDMLKSLAKKYEATLGGSYLEKRGEDVYNTYVLVEPSGDVHRHDKDQPTMVENAFYIGGTDPGLAKTQLGNIGLAVCWETIRTRTVSRLTGNVDVLMTGSHWWSSPDWQLGRKIWEKMHLYNIDFMKRTPGIFASMIGAPNIHAGHCGDLRGQFQLTQKFTVDIKSALMGETQITDASGKILARRELHEGPGFVQAEIELGSKPAVPAPERFWIDPLPFIYRAIWKQQNYVARKSYLEAREKGMIKTYDFTRNEPLYKT